MWQLSSYLWRQWCNLCPQIEWVWPHQTHHDSQTIEMIFVRLMSNICEYLLMICTCTHGILKLKWPIFRFGFFWKLNFHKERKKLLPIKLSHQPIILNQYTQEQICTGIGSSYHSVMPHLRIHSAKRHLHFQFAVKRKGFEENWICRLNVTFFFFFSWLLHFTFGSGFLFRFHISD